NNNYLSLLKILDRFSLQDFISIESYWIDINNSINKILFKNEINTLLGINAKIFTIAISLHATYCPIWLLLQNDSTQYIEQILFCPCQVPIESWFEEFMGVRIDE
ncbi:unnamed protein product, partial [Rotaria sp. Silwood2]